MKRSLWLHVAIVAVFFAVPGLSTLAQYRPDYSELNDSEISGLLRKHTGFLSSAALKGRAVGSEGEKEAAGYVYDRFKEYGLDMLTGREGDLFGISRETEGDTLTSRNIAGFVQGYDKKLNDRYIIIGARLDNVGVNSMTVDGERVEQIYYGANGNASGLAIMMELARMVSSSSFLFRRSIIFVAFGGSRQAFAGSWYFLNRAFADVDKIDAMINLDMLGSGDDFYVYTSSNQDLNSLLSVLSGRLQPITPTLTAQEPYPSDHRSFYSMEIPSAVFTTGRYAEHDTPRDTQSILDYQLMERELEYIYNFTRELANLDSAPEFIRSTPKTDNKTFLYYDCDEKPSFMGHTDLRWFLQKWVYQYLRYPENAIQNGVSGRVNVEFAIDRDGKVKEARVIKGLNDEMDEEVLRVINASPDWKPGKKGGQKVKCYVTLPVDFRLEKKSSKRSFGIRK